METDRKASLERLTLELVVNNHPGVMMHVCGLFARRGFNLDGIVCAPLDDEKRSRMWLRVRNDHQLKQVIKQLSKLEDVLGVRRHHASHEAFQSVEAYFGW